MIELTQKQKQDLIEEWMEIAHGLRRRLTPLSLYTNVLKDEGKLDSSQKTRVKKGIAKVQLTQKDINKFIKRYFTLVKDKETKVLQSALNKFFKELYEAAVLLAKNDSKGRLVAVINDKIAMTLGDIDDRLEKVLETKAKLNHQTIARMEDLRKEFGLD